MSHQSYHNSPARWGGKNGSLEPQLREPTQAQFIAGQLQLQNSLTRSAARRTAPPVTLRKFSWETV